MQSARGAGTTKSDGAPAGGRAPERADAETFHRVAKDITGALNDAGTTVVFAQIEAVAHADVRRLFSQGACLLFNAVDLCSTLSSLRSMWHVWRCGDTVLVVAAVVGPGVGKRHLKALVVYMHPRRRFRVDRLYECYNALVMHCRERGTLSLARTEALVTTWTVSRPAQPMRMGDLTAMSRVPVRWLNRHNSCMFATVENLGDTTGTKNAKTDERKDGHGRDQNQG